MGHPPFARMTVPNALKSALNDGISLFRPNVSRCLWAPNQARGWYTTSSRTKYGTVRILPDASSSRSKPTQLPLVDQFTRRYVSTTGTTNEEGTPYAKLTVGVPKETYPNERRVAVTPQNVALLLKKGFSRVLVERDAGHLAKFPDSAFSDAGATLVGPGTLWAESDILLKVRAPSLTGNNEVARLKKGAVVISFLHPGQNKELVDALASRGATTFAMDMIPRISRAQVFDALSSMANIAGYK
jgi:hypothetical protein